MMQVPLQPDKILKEVIDFNRKLANGMIGLHDVGNVEVESCPKEAVYREDKLTLFRYKPTVDKPSTTPLLIVYALVNRPYMTDLHPERVANLVTMVTPVDFHTPDNVLSDWARELDVDLFVETIGNIPGELLNWSFLSLKPFRLTGQKYADLINIIDDPEQLRNFLRMEKWIFDSPDQAGETWRQFIKYFYQQNKFITGGLEIGGKAVDLKQITMPVLNVYAAQDHLVPPEASIPMGKCVGTSDYTALEFPGGHIGIYVSSKAQKEVTPAISAWLQKRSN